MRVDEVVRAAAAGLGCALVLGGVAVAQEYDRGRNVSVMERERKDYDAIGVHVGGFSVFPRLDTRLVYSSNVFATDSNKTADSYLALTPSVEARSNWSRHQLQGDAGLRLRRFADTTALNENGWYVHTNGRLDIHGDSYATATLGAERTFEEPGSTNFPGNAAKPIPINQWTAGVRDVTQLNRLRLSAGAVYQDLDYHNVPIVFDPANPTLTTVDTGGRDRNAWSYDGKAEFAVSPDTAVFGQLTYTNTDYQDPGGGRFGPNRDSKESGVQVGANFDLSALVRGEVGAGYVQRKYDDSVAFPKVSGLALKGQVEYFPTQLTTLTFNLRRSVEDGTDNNAGGYFATGGGLRVDHEFRRNILINAAADYENDTFEGNTRKDKITTLSAGATYLLNRGLGVNGSIGYVNRDSTAILVSGAPGAPPVTSTNRFDSYDEVRASIGIVLQR
jgi:hypothetical protein